MINNKGGVKFHFCYWDELIFNNDKPKTKENGTTSNTSGEKDSDQTEKS